MIKNLKFILFYYLIILYLFYVKKNRWMKYFEVLDETGMFKKMEKE